jgi:predicted secreted hydrolase
VSPFRSHPAWSFTLLGLLLLSACGGSATTEKSTPPVSVGAHTVHLPADQAGHPNVQNEWWYVVGHLHHGKRQFGFEVTTFKLHNFTVPGASRGSPAVSLYRTDVAITDQHTHRFHQRVLYHFPQSAHVSTTALDIRVGTVQLHGPSPRAMVLSAALPGGALHLNLVSQRRALDVGGSGFIPFSGGYTYYYSLTDLKTSGTIRIGRTTYHVDGISWLDHQWGNWKWTGGYGWTWMALQLDNGVQLSTVDFRGAQGHIRGANVLLANGRLRVVEDVTTRATGNWRSPHTGALYPSGWKVTIPSLRARMTITPAVRDQELRAPGDPRGSYWEGTGHLSGRFMGRAVRGLSYTELVGYAARAKGARRF